MILKKEAPMKGLVLALLIVIFSFSPAQAENVIK
jgi:hypothetical protein